MFDALRGAFTAKPRGDAGVRHRIHAVVFDDPEVCVHAAMRLADEGFVVADVHSPFPLHGIERVKGFRAPGVAAPTLIGGALGLLLAVFLQLYTHAFSWTLDIGGKSFTALPSIVPVAFELTVLMAGFFTVGALLVQARLRPTLSAALPALQPRHAVNDDRFVVLVAEEGAAFSPERFRALCAELQAREVDLGWRVL